MALFAGMKQIRILNIIGMIMTIGGEAFRKASMVTAGRNFNHYVQHTKQKDHRLVTEGVYKFCRHPSYVGWYYWSVGTQVSKVFFLSFAFPIKEKIKVVYY